MRVSQFPVELISSVNDAIFALTAGGPMPPSVDSVYRWLEADGWKPFFEESIAIQAVPHAFFDDERIRHRYILNNETPVSAKDRMRFYRGELNRLARERSRGDIRSQILVHKIIASNNLSGLICGYHFLIPGLPSRDGRQRVQWLGIFDSLRAVAEAIDRSQYLLITDKLRLSESFLDRLSSRSYSCTEDIFSALEEFL